MESTADQMNEVLERERLSEEVTVDQINSWTLLYKSIKVIAITGGDGDVFIKRVYHI
jgi:hypothetical protein